MKLKHIFGLCTMVLGAAALTACDDDKYDVEGNPNNLAYVNLAVEYPTNMPKNTYCYDLYQTPVGPIVNSTPSTIELYAKTTKQSNKDITVTFEMLPDMEVSGYDKFPAGHGFVFSMPENTVTIPAGSNKSNTITVTVDDSNVNWALFDGDAYVLPIKAVASDGAKVSEEMPLAYIGVNVDHKDGMVNPNSNSTAGLTSITDKSAWSGTYSVPATNESGSCSRACFDGNVNNYGYLVFNHEDKCNEEVITTIDLGSVQTIGAVMFQYFGWYYYIKDGSLETSTDGVNWTVQGSREWPGQYAGRQAYFVFWAPMEMRYFRLTSHSYHGGTGEGQVLAEVFAYK